MPEYIINAELFPTYVTELRALRVGCCSGYRTNWESDEKVSSVNLTSDPYGSWIVHKQLDPEPASLL